MNATNKRCLPFLIKNASRYNVKDFSMTTLFSHEKYSSRRLLKRSNPPFFRQMLQVASTARPRFSRTPLMMAMERVNEAWCVDRKNRGTEVAWLLKIVNTGIGCHIHSSPPLGIFRECFNSTHSCFQRFLKAPRVHTTPETLARFRQEWMSLPSRRQ